MMLTRRRSAVATGTIVSLGLGPQDWLPEARESSFTNPFDTETLMTLIPPERLHETFNRFLRYLNDRYNANDPPRSDTGSFETRYAAKWCREEVEEIRDAFLKMFDPLPDDGPVTGERTTGGR
jgi:hypothetical protein